MTCRAGRSVTPCDFCVSGLASAQGPALLQQRLAGRPVDRPVDPATAQQRLVGGVDDGVDLQRRDVAPVDAHAVGHGHGTPARRLLCRTTSGVCHHRMDGRGPLQSSGARRRCRRGRASSAACRIDPARRRPAEPRPPAAAPCAASESPGSPTAAPRRSGARRPGACRNPSRRALNGPSPGHRTLTVSPSTTRLTVHRPLAGAAFHTVVHSRPPTSTAASTASSATCRQEARMRMPSRRRSGCRADERVERR